MMRVRPKAVVNFALAAVFTSAAGLAPDVSAQTPARGQSRPAPPRAEARAPLGTEADAAADVSITARVTAESLRFERVPNPRVEFPGRQKLETAWEAERENLPPQVRPGETYRNIGITLRIRSAFADIDRIVAEALGEVPVDDEAQPPSPAQPRPPATSTPPADSTTPPAQAPAEGAAAARPGRGPARGGRKH